MRTESKDAEMTGEQKQIFSKYEELQVDIENAIEVDNFVLRPGNDHNDKYSRAVAAARQALREFLAEHPEAEDLVNKYYYELSQAARRKAIEAGPDPAFRELFEEQST